MINNKKENILFVLNFKNFNDKHDMLYYNCIEALSKNYNVDILLFGQLIFTDNRFNNYKIYTVNNTADTLLMCNNFIKCTNTYYKGIIFYDNVSNFPIDSSIVQCLNYKYSYKISFTNQIKKIYIPNVLKSNDNVSYIFDYNILLSKEDYNWSLQNKPHIYKKENTILVEDISSINNIIR